MQLNCIRQYPIPTWERIPTKKSFLGCSSALGLAAWCTYLDSRAEHYRNILDVHFCFQFLCNNMVHMHNQPRNQEMVTLWQLFQQPLALLNFLSFCALSTSVFKAGHELFGKQIFRQFPQVLFEQAGDCIGLVFFQVRRFFTIIGCLQLVNF